MNYHDRCYEVVQSLWKLVIGDPELYGKCLGCGQAWYKIVDFLVKTLDPIELYFLDETLWQVTKNKYNHKEKPHPIFRSKKPERSGASAQFDVLGNDHAECMGSLIFSIQMMYSELKKVPFSLEWKTLASYSRKKEVYEGKLDWMDEP